MKENAQKILLCIYSYSRSDQVVLTTDQLRLAVPDMSDGGYRSLLLFLERKGWLVKESVSGKQYVSITEAGREALKAKFPALNEKWLSWQGEWHTLVFIEAPKADPQFRYLRQLLIAERALPLTRGVYLAAGGFTPQVLSTCASIYPHSVVIFSVGAWEFGLDRPIIVNFYDLASTASVYSSISTAIDGLLVNFNSSKRRTNQHKSHISTTIDRLWNGLKEDPGFTNYYFPGLLDIPSLLKKLNLLIKL